LAERRMAIFENEFSWSFSRHSLFQECSRAYIFSNYGTWGGWQGSADEQTRELYIQKKLTSRAMWTGTLVHDAAEEALRKLRERQDCKLDELAKKFLIRARREIAESERGANRQSPSKFTGFREHYYDEELSQADWNETLEEIDRQIRGLADNESYKRIRSFCISEEDPNYLKGPDKILEIEELVKIDIDGVPVWVRLDALLKGLNGEFVVLDWKTGKAHVDDVIAAQLGVYGLYCVLHHGAREDRIVAMHVNLRSNSWAPHPINAETMAGTRRLIRDSAERMLCVLKDRDKNIAEIDEFPPLPEGSARCNWCSFRRTCDRE